MYTVDTNVRIIMCVLFLLDSTYTVEEAVEKLGFGSFQLLVTVFSGLLWVSREGGYCQLVAVPSRS